MSASSSPFQEVCPTERMQNNMDTGARVCVDPTQTTAANVCPQGATADPRNPGWCKSATLISLMGCPEGYIKPNTGDQSVCQKIVTPTCPAGSTFKPLWKNRLNGNQPRLHGVCVPNTTATYPRPLQGIAFPCDGDDEGEVLDAGHGPTGFTCYRTSSGGQAQGQSQAGSPMTPPDFQSLTGQYHQQVQAYDTAVQAALASNNASQLPTLRTMSEQIQVTLNKMIESLTYLKKETPDLKTERDKLLEDLRRIQRDYSGMLEATDDLETLRRIRQQENGEARRLLLLYLLAFIFLSVMLIVYIAYTGRKTETTAMSAPTPTMSPALT